MENYIVIIAALSLMLAVSMFRIWIGKQFSKKRRKAGGNKKWEV